MVPSVCSEAFWIHQQECDTLPGVVARVLLVEELYSELPLFIETPVPGGVKLQPWRVAYSTAQPVLHGRQVCQLLWPLHHHRLSRCCAPG